MDSKYHHSKCHGRTKTAVLQNSGEVCQWASIRTLVINWWFYASDCAIGFSKKMVDSSSNELQYIKRLNPLCAQGKYNLIAMLSKRNLSAVFPFLWFVSKGKGYPNFQWSSAKNIFQKVNAKWLDWSETIRSGILAGIVNLWCRFTRLWRLDICQNLLLWCLIFNKHFQDKDLKEP